MEEKKFPPDCSLSAQCEKWRLDMETDKTISVIIPIYNVEPYIKRCLDSVMEQTYRDMEIILIDDGSPDNCGKICDEYARMDRRIIVVHKRNEGVGAARNTGIDMARGKWITFVDPDDWLERDYYEKMMDGMDGKDVDVFSNGGYFAEYQQCQETRRRIKENYYYSGQGYSEKREVFCAKVLVPNLSTDGFVGETSLAVLWNNLYCASFLREHMIYNIQGLHPLEDTLFMFTVFNRADSVAGCAYIGYHYNLTNESASTKRFRPDAFDQLCLFLEKINAYRQASSLHQSAMMDNALAAFALTQFGTWCLKCYFFHPNVAKSNKEISKELKVAKYHPLLAWSYRRRSNQYLLRSIVLIKYALLLPGVRPLKASFCLTEFLRSVKRDGFRGAYLGKHEK